jgi:serine/threonine-protein kinase RsbW
VKKHSVEIQSQRNNIKLVESLMEEVNKDFKLTDDEYQKMMIAVTEIVMNAIIHGNKEDKSKKVCVAVHYTDSEMKIIITDDGEGFDIGNLPDPTLSEHILDVHGRGVFIARAMVDELDYRNIEGKGTEFTLLVRKKTG